MIFTCSDVVTHLSEYLDGTLDAERRAALEAHVATCDNCTVMLKSTQKTIVIYRRQHDRMALSPAQGQALLDRIRAALDEG